VAKQRSAVLIASLIWGGSILLSRLIGVIREAVLGRVLGVTGETDVYFTAFLLPDFLNYLLAGGALSLVFIPLFNEHLTRGDEAGGWEAFSAIATVLSLMLVVATGALWLLAPGLTDWIAPGFDAPSAQALVRLTRIMLPAQIFHLLGGLLSATLQARDKHALPALAPLLYNVCVIAGGLLGGAAMGAEGFAWGVLVGSALGPFGLPLVGCLREGLHFRPTLNIKHPALRTYLVRSLPIMLGLSVIAVDDWILRQQGSLLAAGSIATITFAKTLMKVPMGVFGLATGAAAFPTLTRLLSEGRRAEAYTLLSSAVKRMLVLAFAAQVLLTCAGPEIARVIYGGRLEAGGHQEAIGSALGWICVGLWAWSAQSLIARGFYAQGNTWTPTIVGTAVALLCYPLYVGLRVELGVDGLAMASSVAVTAYMVILMALLRRQFPGTPDGFVTYFAKMVPATAAGIGAGIAARPLVMQTGITVVDGAAAGIVGGLVFGAATLVLRVEEVREVGALVAGKVRRRLRRG